MQGKESINLQYFPEEDDIGTQRTRMFYSRRKPSRGREMTGLRRFHHDNDSQYLSTQRTHQRRKVESRGSRPRHRDTSKPRPTRRSISRERPDRGRLSRSDLRLKLKEKRNSFIEEPPRKRAKTSNQCPMEGCNMDAGGRLRRYMQRRHLPGMFHLGDTEDKLENRQFQSTRRHALEIIANFLFGIGSRVEDLVEFVNSRSDWEDVTIPEDTRASTEAVANANGWLQPDTWSICPVNSPAALIHWRPLILLINRLQPYDREELFTLLGERWVISQGDKKERKGRRRRLNPLRRHRILRKEEKKRRNSQSPAPAREDTEQHLST